MNNPQLKTYVKNHWCSLFTIGVGIFFLIFFVYAGGLIITGKSANPFDLSFITFLVISLWGIELFRLFANISKDIFKKEKTTNEAEKTTSV